MYVLQSQGALNIEVQCVLTAQSGSSSLSPYYPSLFHHLVGVVGLDQETITFAATYIQTTYIPIHIMMGQSPSESVLKPCYSFRSGIFSL